MWELMSVQYPSFSTDPSLGIAIPVSATVLSSPIIGILSESYFGRYKILTLSLYLWLISIMLAAVALILSSDTCLSLSFLFIALSTACYAPCIIPFTIDQMVGASGEELSFTLYWMVWCWDTCASAQSLYVCSSQLTTQIHTKQAILLFILYVSFIIAYVMTQCCNHILMTSPQLSNPIKSVVQVLNYARKNKFPVSRSAFTYWEEEWPSRIDLGNSKYRSPFTLEEVEDVKTILKLIHLISCASLIFVLGSDAPFTYRKLTCNKVDI